MSDSGDKPTISAPKGTWGSLLAAPRLISTPAQSLATNSVLRPPQLKTGNNPFAKIVAQDTASDGKKPENKTEDPQPEKRLESSKESVPLFLPLRTPTENITLTAGNNAPCTHPEPISANCGFVFGQNLQDRIVKGEEESTSNGESHSNTSSTNGTAELLFSAAVKANNTGQTTAIKDESSSSSQNSSWSWVSESPAPAIPPSGPIITGEEDEDNVIQMNCRLFAFENGQWKERGRGHLRLNDYEHGSRLVCRSAGSLRVLLNTKIWADMTVDLAGTKSLRVTATDAQNHVKIFLIMARPDEIVRLSKFLNSRVDKAKQRDSIRSEESGEPISTSEKSGSDPGTGTKDPNQSSEPSKSNCATLVNEVTDAAQEESNVENHTESQTKDGEGNPIVIISNEEESAALPTKRPLEVSSQEDVQSKKVCLQQPAGEDVPS